MTLFDNLNALADAIIRKVLFIFIIAVIITIAYRKRELLSYFFRKRLKFAFRDNACGIVFGRFLGGVLVSPAHQEGHVFVQGGTGSGKTQAVLLPSIISFIRKIGRRRRGGHCFAIDISGDIIGSVDSPKLVYSAINPNTTPYNAFCMADTEQTISAKNERLEELAFLLMPESPQMNDTSRFFNTEGRKILTSALIAFYHAGMDFVEICETIYKNSWMDLFRKIDDCKIALASDLLNSFVGCSEQNNAGCKQACDASIKLFATNETLKQTLRRPRRLDSGEAEPSITPQALENTNVFIYIPDEKLELYAPLVRIITSQFLGYMSGRPADNTTPILFCIDEFASFRIDILGALRKLRKKHVRIMILTQSIEDISLNYSITERNAMFSNFAFKVCLGATTPEEQEWWSKLTGYISVQKKSVSTNENTTTETISESKELAVPPEEWGRLKKRLILVHPSGFIKLRKNYYFKYY